MPVRIIYDEEIASVSEVMNPFGLPDADPETEQKPEGLSFCLIMKNEERFLEACLASVASVADELCIVDTGSTDRSIEIARSFGARIEVIEWPNDFGKARNVSLAMANYRWILTLDADEEMTPQSLHALQEIKHAPAALTSVMCRIQNITVESDGVEAKFSHYLPRLFPNTSRMRYKGAVHERLVVDDDYGAPMVNSPITLLHYGYQEEILVGRDKTNRNLPLIEREAAENPNDTFCVFNLAMVQMSLGQTDECITNFERMFELAEEKNENTNRAYFAPAYVTLAMEYYRKKGDYDHAMELVDKCLEINPYYPNAIYFKSNLYAIKGKHDEAREALKRCVEAQEFIKSYAFVDEEICLWKAKYYLGLSYAGTREYVDALHWLERAIEARPAFMEINLARARVLESMGRKSEAENAFHELAETFNDDATLLEYLQCLTRLGRYSKVLEVVAREANIRDLGMRMRLFLAGAQATLRLGRTDAGDYLNQALALEKHPHSAQVIQALEELYAELGMEEERNELREWEMTALPSCRNANDCNRRTARFIEAGEFAMALEVAKLGLKISPEDQHLLLNAGICESRLNASEDAIGRLGTLDPYINRETYAVGTYLRALVQHRDGHIEGAVDTLESLLEWEPTQIDALLMRGRLLAQLQRIPEAELAFENAMHYDSARASLELASLYLRLGRFDQAQVVAERAISLAGATA